MADSKGTGSDGENGFPASPSRNQRKPRLPIAGNTKKITAYAIASLECRRCGAKPGETCTLADPGKAVCYGRFYGARTVLYKAERDAKGNDA